MATYVSRSDVSCNNTVHSLPACPSRRVRVCVCVCAKLGDRRTPTLKILVSHSPGQGPKDQTRLFTSEECGPSGSWVFCLNARSGRSAYSDRFDHLTRGGSTDARLLRVDY